MKISRIVLWMLVLCLVTAVDVARADTGSMSKWFSVPTKSTKSGKKKSTSAKSPRVLDTLSTAPKKMMTGTKSLFTPASSKRGSKPPVKIKPKQPSLLKRLFTPEQPPQPATVNEFLKQPRVKP